jgi:predicted nucleic acid-binding protein
MVDRAFTDTNILLRAMNPDAVGASTAEQLIRDLRRKDVELWVSRQVIREYLVQMTRPGFLATPVSSDLAADEVRKIQLLFRIADDTQDVTRILLELLRQYPTAKKQIHDANIVATMLANGIDTLLTLNVSDMERFTDRSRLMSDISS